MKLRNATWIAIVGFLLVGASEVVACACGAITLSQGLDGAQAVLTRTILKLQKSKDLVLVGTVTKIDPIAATHSIKNWAIVVHVDKVVSGNFAGTTFTFTIHSPSLAGLQVGKTHTIKATWTDAGYVVDDQQWRKRAQVSVVSFDYSQAKDVLGWENSRWGMSDKDLVAAFGSRLQKLPKREAFLKWHTDYVISTQSGGVVYTVFFQMADDTNRLSQVLVRLNEMESKTSREDVFKLLASSLGHDYGEPTAQTNERYRFLSKFNGMALSRTWKFPTTTMELAYDWDDQIYASTLTIRDRKSTRLNSSHIQKSRMPSSA